MMRYTHIVIASLVLLSIAHNSRAQQDPMYSQYMFNTLAFNPAYAGSADVFSAMALSRHQWVGFEGAPTTQTLSLHSPLPIKSLALGGNILHDQAGPITQTAAFVDIAYRFKTGESSRLAFGLSGGVNLFQASLSELETVDADPINGNITGELLPNFGFGAYWHGDRYYLGISAPKLLQNSLNTEGGALITTAEEERHYFLIAGIVKDISPDLKMKPSIMARVVDGAPLSADVNLNFLLRDRIWFGGMYRIANSFGVMFQYQFSEQLKAGYAFDMTTTKVGAYNAGTHEIMVGYDFKWTKGNVISPRYF